MRESQPLVKLIHEGLSVDAFSAGAGPSRIASLYHEVLDHPMKNGPVVIALKAKLDEVAAGSRRLTSPEINLDLPIIRLKYDFRRSGRLLRLLNE